MESRSIFQWPEPWGETGLEMGRALEAELKCEVTLGHPLHGVSVSALARRDDCDDVLFAIIGSPSVAVVHLSYRKETNPSWPYSQFYADLSEWEEQATSQDNSTV